MTISRRRFLGAAIALPVAAALPLPIVAPVGEYIFRPEFVQAIAAIYWGHS